MTKPIDHHAEHHAMRVQVIHANSGSSIKKLVWSNFDAESCEATSPAATPEPEILAEPKVEFVQVHGQPDRIIVTCGCGKRIEIACEF